MEWEGLRDPERFCRFPVGLHLADADIPEQVRGQLPQLPALPMALIPGFHQPAKAEQRTENGFRLHCRHAVGNRRGKN